MTSQLSIWNELHGATHLDFGPDAVVPLQRGRLLDRTASGDMYETTCNGTILALKQVSNWEATGLNVHNEAKMLKKLRHKHIVEIVGSYTYRGLLGVLLWPAAPSNLATFLEDIEELKGLVEGRRTATMAEAVSSGGRVIARLRDTVPFRKAAIDILENKAALTETYKAAITRLNQCYVCIVSAVSYLHREHIQLADLRPSNILLSRDHLWLAGFGALTDFSFLTVSKTSGRGRGTSIYFAPEVAAFHPNGYAADIFSLGCIFLEMTVICTGLALEYLSTLRPVGDRSFQANIERIEEWFEPLREDSSVRLRHLLFEIKQMLKVDPKARPTATELDSSISGISRLKPANGDADSLPLYGLCCVPPSAPPCEHLEEIDRLRSQNIALKNILHAQREWMPSSPWLHEYKAEKERMQAKASVLRNLAMAREEWFNHCLDQYFQAQGLRTVPPRLRVPRDRQTG